MKGSKWTGDEHDWRRKPEHYSAIHFHHDDVYDAGWETSVSITLPEDIKSGPYALHVSCGDSDATVNPVNADRIIEQLRARAEYIDPSAGALFASDESRIDNGGRTYRQQDYAQQGRIVLRKVLVEGLGHAWSGGDAQYEFNDAAGPDAGRLILDFVTQYRREIHPIASHAPKEQERASIESGGG